MSKVVWITLLVCGVIVCIVTGSLWLRFRFAEKRPQDPIPKIPWYITALFWIGVVHIIVGGGLGIYEWQENKKQKGKTQSSEQNKTELEMRDQSQPPALEMKKQRFSPRLKLLMTT